MGSSLGGWTAEARKAFGLDVGQTERDGAEIGRRDTGDGRKKKEEFPGSVLRTPPGNSFPQICVVSVQSILETSYFYKVTEGLGYLVTTCIYKLVTSCGERKVVGAGVSLVERS
jgi:hypothetical protein